MNDIEKFVHVIDGTRFHDFEFNLVGRLFFRVHVRIVTTADRHVDTQVFTHERVTSLGSFPIHLVFPGGGNLAGYTETNIERITFEIFLHDTDFLNHRLFTRIFIRSNANVVTVVIVDVYGRSFLRLPTLVLLQALEDLLPRIFANVGIKQGAIMLTKTNLDFDIILVLMSLENGENLIDDSLDVHFFLIFFTSRHSLKCLMFAKCNERARKSREYLLLQYRPSVFVVHSSTIKLFHP